MDVGLDDLRNDIMGRVAAAGDLAALDEVRVAALGKKGSVTELVKQLGGLPPERRREAGQAFNALKQEVEAALAARRWLLAERAPLSRPDPRWDRLLYGVAAVERHLRAR